MLWERSAGVWLGFTFFKVFFKTLDWLWNETLDKLQLAMKDMQWVFSGFWDIQWQVQVWDADSAGRVRSLRELWRFLKFLRVRNGLNICEAGASKTIQPAQDSSWSLQFAGHKLSAFLVLSQWSLILLLFFRYHYRVVCAIASVEKAYTPLPIDFE